MFRSDWLQWKQVFPLLIKQEKDGASKYLLHLLGVPQSRHITKKRRNYYSSLFSFNQYATKKDKGYFELDLNIILEMEKIKDEKLKASTFIHFIDLVGCSLFKDGIRIINCATWELKNLMCGAFSKQTIRSGIHKLDRLGFIQMRQGGRQRYGAHIYSKWHIVITPSVALFKTTITSLKFFNINSINLKNTFIAIPKSQGPPNGGCIFNELEIEELFSSESYARQWTSFNSCSQEDWDWYINAQGIADRSFLASIHTQYLTNVEKLRKKALNSLIVNFTKALKNPGRGFMQRYGIALSPDDNYTCNVPRIVEFFKQCWLPQLPKFIKSPVGAFISDFKKPKSIFWDNYLRWSDEKHEIEKRQRISRIDNVQELLPTIVTTEATESTFTTDAIKKLCEITKDSFESMLELTIKWPRMAQRILEKGSFF